MCLGENIGTYSARTPWVWDMEKILEWGIPFAVLACTCHFFAFCVLSPRTILEIGSGPWFVKWPYRIAVYACIAIVLAAGIEPLIRWVSDRPRYDYDGETHDIRAIVRVLVAVYGGYFFLKFGERHADMMVAIEQYRSLLKDKGWS